MNSKYRKSAIFIRVCWGGLVSWYCSG